LGGVLCSGIPVANPIAGLQPGYFVLRIACNINHTSARLMFLKKKIQIKWATIPNETLNNNDSNSAGRVESNFSHGS
jgi:hypothetical protein